MNRGVRCIVCGVSFTADRSDAQTCSNRCRQQLFRDRAVSPVVATVGGISMPVLDFTATLVSFPSIPTATITVPVVRGEPARDAASCVRVTVQMGDVVLCVGDLERITRNSDRSTLYIRGTAARLAEVRLPFESVAPLTPEMLAERIAAECGLIFVPPETPSGRPLSLVASADGASPRQRMASEWLLLGTREVGGRPFITHAGELALAAPSAIPRAIEVRNQTVSTFESTNLLTVVVRAGWNPQTRGASVRSASLADVPPDCRTYLITVPSANQQRVDQLAARLTRDLTRQLVEVEAEVIGTVDIGEQVTIDHPLLAGRPVTVERVEHSFTVETGLATRANLTYWPPPPAAAQVAQLRAA